MPSPTDISVEPLTPAAPAAPAVTSRQVRANVAANYLAAVWAGAAQILVLPIYLDMLGADALGMIGLFAALQGWLQWLDFGLGPTLNREFARYDAAAQDEAAMARLLRSMEWVYGVVALLIVLGIGVCADFLARHWIQVVGVQSAATAFQLMGGVIALRWMGALYRSGLQGLQAQVRLNAVNILMVSLRTFGALLALAVFGHSLMIFLSYQAIIALLETVVLRFTLFHVFPGGRRGAYFDPRSLASIRKYAGGVMLISVLAACLTQVDKLILPTVLSLGEFGFYTLAATLAGGLFAAITPVANAVGPRLAELVAAKNQSALKSAVHTSAQLLSIITVAPATVMILYPGEVLQAWTGSAEVVRTSATALQLLALGTLFNGFMNIPYLLQLANGSTRISIVTNAVAVLLVVPALIWCAPRYGVVGCASVWAAINASYLLIAAPLILRRFLRGETTRWYLQDVLLPFSGAILAVIMAGRWLGLGKLQGRVQLTMELLFLGVVAAMVAALASAIGRATLQTLLRRVRG